MISYLSSRKEEERRTSLDPGPEKREDKRGKAGGEGETGRGGGAPGRARRCCPLKTADKKGSEGGVHLRKKDTPEDKPY